MSKKQIMLCFVRSDSSILEASWLNRAASYFATTKADEKPYIHAEIMFCQSNDAEAVSGLACSIVYGANVHLQRKRFSKKEWFFRSMSVTSEQYEKMLSFCQNHVGESFNHAGYFMYWAPVQPRPMFYQWLGMKPRWYCSEIVLGALHAGNVLGEEVPTAMHPHQLFEITKDMTMVNCGRTLRDITLSFV